MAEVSRRSNHPLAPAGLGSDGWAVVGALGDVTARWHVTPWRIVSLGLAVDVAVSTLLLGLFLATFIAFLVVMRPVILDSSVEARNGSQVAMKIGFFERLQDTQKELWRSHKKRPKTLSNHGVHQIRSRPNRGI